MSLIPSPAQPPLQVVLTCGERDCQHTFEPDPLAFATGSLACPACGGVGTLGAELTEPTTAGGARGE